MFARSGHGLSCAPITQLCGCGIASNKVHREAGHGKKRRHATGNPARGRIAQFGWDLPESGRDLARPPLPYLIPSNIEPTMPPTTPPFAASLEGLGMYSISL